MANKPKIRKERSHGEKEGGKREKTTTLSEKKEETSNVSEQRDKGWIHVLRVHDTTHLAVTTRQGNRRSRTTPHKERLERTRQWQVAMNRWDLATKKWEPKLHDVLCSKDFFFKCFTDRTLLNIQFGLK